MPHIKDSEARKAQQRKYYEKNKEKIAAQQKKYYQENKEKWKKYREENKARKKKYYEENKEKIAAQKKKYYEENKTQRKKYYEENKEKIAARQKKRYEENKEKFSAKRKKYYEENKEKEIAHGKKYYQENKEKIAAQWKKRYKKKSAENPSVVYMIECKATNKYYIGQTSLWFEKRVRQHRSLFNNKKRNNDCGIGMQEDYNIHGPDAFEYSILKELSPDASEEELLAAEKECINNFIKEGKELYNKLV